MCRHHDYRDNDLGERVMAAKIRVTGATELAAAFRQLARTASEPRRRKARQAAGQVIRDAAREGITRNDSVITGALRESLGVAEDVSRRNRTLIGPRLGTF